MFYKVRENDPELWDAVYDEFGPEEISWIQCRKKIKKDDPELFKQIMTKYGKLKSMWD
jgi:hypothetical protein